MRKLFITALLVCFGLSAASQSDSLFTTFFHDSKPRNIIPHCQVLLDPHRTLRIDDVTGNAGNQFVDFDSLYDVKDFAGWFRMRFCNSGQSRISYMLLFYQFGDSIEIYEQSGGRMSCYPSGYLIPYSSKPYYHPHNYYPLALAPGESKTLYVRVKDHCFFGGVKPTMIVLQRESLFHNFTHFHYFFLGTMALLIIVSLVLSSAFRDIQYVVLVIPLISFSLWFGDKYGTLHQHLHLPLSWAKHFSVYSMGWIQPAVLFLYPAYYLNLRKHAPRIFYLFHVLVSIYVLFAIEEIFTQQYDPRIANAILISALIVYGCVVWLAVKGVHNTRIYVLFMLPIFLSGIYWLLALVFQAWQLQDPLATIQAGAMGSSLIIGYILYERLHTTLKERIEVVNENKRLVLEQELRSFHLVLTTQELERARIAKDLHDRLGSILSTVKLYFSSAEAQIDQLPHPDKTRLNKASNLLDEACDELRRISHDLASVELTRFGLVSAVRHLTNTIADAGKMNITFQDFSNNHRLENAAEISLYRVVQEILNNTLKHSGADTVNIQVNQRDASLNILIEDNGVGFDLHDITTKDGLGLKNIQTRVTALRGTLHVDTGKGKGTTTIIDIPI